MGKEIQTYRDLRIWEEAMELVEEIYKITSAFPKDELYELTSQMRRSAISIPSNIAEGHGRKGSKEFMHHLSIAKGSLAELETQLILSLRLQYLNRDDLKPIWQKTQT